MLPTSVQKGRSASGLAFSCNERLFAVSGASMSVKLYDYDAVLAAGTLCAPMAMVANVGIAGRSVHFALAMSCASRTPSCRAICLSTVSSCATMMRGLLLPHCALLAPSSCITMVHGCADGLAVAKALNVTVS